MEAVVMLADYAQVHGGKLNVVGAGVNLIGTPKVEPPHPIGIFAAVLVSVPWQAHNQAHKLRVSLEDSDGTALRIADHTPGFPIADEDVGSVVAQFNVGRAPIMQPGDDSLVPLAVPLQVEVPSLGAYRVVVQVDGTQLAVARFRVLQTSDIR